MNRRSFFGLVGGAAVAGLFSRHAALGELLEGDAATDGPRHEVWVQAVLSTGATVNWVIVNPEPGQTYPGPYMHFDGTIVGMTISSPELGLENIPVEVFPTCFCAGDSLGIKFDEFNLSS